ncbi:MAG: hypothetical protein IBJ11_07375 [Phycisphaerales bacterium]|nr:hypothetical protein [Phycisphaerales bacterium]
MRNALAIPLLACVLALGAGCRGRPKNFDNDNDALRRQLLEAQGRIDALQAERNELAAKVGELSAKLEAARGPAADVIAALPRCAGIRIDNLTGLADRDGAPGFEALDVYVRPIDGRERFVQIAGRLAVQAVLLPRPGDAGGQPRTLASRTLTPGEVREAYRSSVLGTHYAVEMKIDPPLEAGHGPVAVTVAFDDGLTGQSFTSTATLP